MGRITHRRRAALEHGHPGSPASGPVGRSFLTARLGALILASFCIVACGKDDEEIRVYRVVKAPLENPAPQTMPSPASMPPPSSMTLPPDHPPVGAGASMPAAAPAAPETASNAPAPAHWEPQPLAQMRKASFLVRNENGTQADISLITLGPSSDVLGNVNRWLGQLGKPPITAEQLPQVARHLPDEGHITVVDIEGKPEQGDANKDGRIIAAITPDGNGTAFFKLRGNPALAGAEKENFLSWVKAHHRHAQ